MTLIRINKVIQLTGLSLSTIRRLEKAGQFPKRVKLSRRAVGWVLEEVQEWITSKLGSEGGRND